MEQIPIRSIKFLKIAGCFSSIGYNSGLNRSRWQAQSHGESIHLRQRLSLICYAQGFTVVCVLRFLKYSNISSFVILDNFSLNLSLC
jgi:hypothetical protein